MIRTIFVATSLLITPSVMLAQTSSPLEGVWAGTLQVSNVHLRLQLNLKPIAQGWQCTLDSLDQNSIGIPCNLTSAANPVRFDVPSIGASYKGTLSGDSLSGTFTQGADLALSFTRQTKALSVTPSAPLTHTLAPIEGTWLGTIADIKLRLQLKVRQTKEDWLCTVDSLDQGANGIPCRLTSATNPIRFEIPSVGAIYIGTLSGDTLTGTFTQAGDHALVLTRQSQPAAAQKPAPPQPALPPADADTIKAILDKDLEATLATGELAPSTHAGVTIGVLSHGKRVIFSYGTAKPDSVFEIGSITKTFTATILAQMVEQKIVTLDTPVRELLPPGAVAKPEGREITLLDLSDQHSGLPRMPGNFKPADRTNPYVDYTPEKLYQFVAQHGVALPDNTPFLYSNLGVGLLGQALANRADKSYADLLHDEVTGPLGLADTGPVLTPSMRARFIQGYHDNHEPAHSWEFQSLAGCGAIRSTAADLLTYLDAQLHPDHIPSATPAFPNAATLAAAIRATHIPRADTAPGHKIALNWFFVPNLGAYWHNGGTAGYNSYANFNPEEDYAVVVLFNTSGEDFADKLGGHIIQRLRGKPAISLAP